jgi:hypothetical protein
MDDIIERILSNKFITEVDFHVLFTDNENFIDIHSLSDENINEIYEKLSNRNKMTFIESVITYRDLVKHTLSGKKSTDTHYYKKKSTYIIVNEILTINHEIVNINADNFPNISTHNDTNNKTINIINFDTFDLFITKSSDNVNNIFIKFVNFSTKKNFQLKKFIENFTEEYTAISDILSKYK